MKSINLKVYLVNIILVLLVLGFSLSLYSKVVPIPEYVDSLDNLKIAFNLTKYHQFSASNINGDLTTKERDTLAFFAPNIQKPVTVYEAQPTALREPLPIYITSLILKKLDLINKYPNVQSLNAGKPLMLIKSQNFIYLLLLFTGLVMLLGQFIQHPLLKVFATLILLILVSQHLTGSMYFLLSTELLASVLMVWCCYFLIQAIQKQRLNDWLLAGVMYGLLVLTKAAFIYIGVVLVASLLIYFTYLRQHRHFKGLCCFVLISTIVVIPWMVRNYQQLHFFGVSERAADVLLVRAKKNLMTPIERKGAICVYTANEVLRPACAKYFGFNNNDLSSTGRLKRLLRGSEEDKKARSEMNPEKAISFYFHATTIAYRARFDAYLKQQSIIVANQATSKLAMQAILQHPIDHLISTLLFAWRGLNVRYADIYTYFGFFALIAMGGLGLAKQRPQFLMVALLPTLAFAFYAFLSHFIPRYADPFIPFWMLAVVVTLYGFCKYFLSLFRR